MSAAAVAAAAIAQAVKASGVVVRLEPTAFLAILNRAEAPLVVTAPGGVFGGKYQYLTSYKGLAFCTLATEPLQLPPAAEIVAAAAMWIPR